MKTERLYYDNPGLLEFEARVVEVIPDGSRQAVILDRTAFHPTGGGQPNDTGFLAGAEVVDVTSDAAGRVLHHLITATPPAPGNAVQGQVNEVRRQDHLQQHSAQHLLSASFVRARGAATRSFHMGARTSSIDLDRVPEALGDLRKVEDLANRVIREDRPMSARIVDEAEARALPLRKDLSVQGEVRIVSIEAFDMTPCGGTHARSTGGIGMIAILASERHRRGTRVEFVAGDRVRDSLHRTADESAGLGVLLSAPAGERAEALERLIEDRRRDARRLKELARRTGALEAAARVAGAREGILREVLEDRGRDEIEAMARGLADAGVAALLGWRDGGTARVVMATPGAPAAGKLMRELARQFGVRGGGGDRFAQAGGIPVDSLEEFLEALERAARG